MKKLVELMCDGMSPERLLNSLEEELAVGRADDEIEFEIPEATRSGGVDATVLVAVISSTASVVSALVTAALALAAKRAGARLEYKGADGSTITVPWNAKPENVDAAVKAVRDLRSPRLRIRLDEG